MMQPDPFSEMLDIIADLKESMARLHADLLRGDRAEALLAEVVDKFDRLEDVPLFAILKEARAFLAAAPDGAA